MCNRTDHRSGTRILKLQETSHLFQSFVCERIRLVKIVVKPSVSIVNEMLLRTNPGKSAFISKQQQQTQARWRTSNSYIIHYQDNDVFTTLHCAVQSSGIAAVALPVFFFF